MILGPGFSYYAGLPLARDTNQYFMRDNSKMLIRFSSDEWKWFDLASEVDQNNGSLSFDHIAYGYILNELVNYFINANGDFTNYEEFFQFVIVV